MAILRTFNWDRVQRWLFHNVGRQVTVTIDEYSDRMEAINTGSEVVLFWVDAELRVAVTPEIISARFTEVPEYDY